MVRVAACQYAPVSEIKARKDQVRTVLEKAEIERIDFVCFPEGFLTGYYEQENLAHINSLKVGEGAFGDWLEVFRGTTSTSIIGFNEREGSKIFDSAAIIENGKLLGVQRKHYLYHNYFASGTSFVTFQSKGITFGVVICLDTIYFEPARLLALQGASILFSPMCNRVPPNHPYAKRPSYYSHFVARSFENRCWLVTADWGWLNDGTSICPGHSVIYNPDGQECARSNEGVEQMVISDIPIEHLISNKGRRIHGSKLLSDEIAKLDSERLESSC